MPSARRGRKSSAHQLRQLGNIRRNPSCLISDTSHMAGNRHTEEKYEHTNRSCNQKTPARVPCLCSGLGGNDGPSARSDRVVVLGASSFRRRRSFITWNDAWY